MVTIEMSTAQDLQISELGTPMAAGSGVLLLRPLLLSRVILEAFPLVNA